jgi:hypothetical protein
MSGPHLVIYTMVKDNTTWKVPPHNLLSVCVCRADNTTWKVPPHHLLSLCVYWAEIPLDMHNWLKNSVSRWSLRTCLLSPV